MDQIWINLTHFPPEQNDRSTIAFATCGLDSLVCLFKETDGASQTPLPVLRMRVGHEAKVRAERGGRASEKGVLWLLPSSLRERSGTSVQRRSSC